MTSPLRAGLLLVGLALAALSFLLTAVASSADVLRPRRLDGGLDRAAQGVLVAAFSSVAASWLGGLLLPLLQLDA